MVVETAIDGVIYRPRAAILARFKTEVSKLPIHRSSSHPYKHTFINLIHLLLLVVVVNLFLLLTHHPPSTDRLALPWRGGYNRTRRIGPVRRTNIKIHLKEFVCVVIPVSYRVVANDELNACASCPPWCLTREKTWREGP